MLKQKIYDYGLNLLNGKIKVLQDELEDLKTGRGNDSKSSAGDKHETAQAMMQLEQEKINSQLSELIAQKGVMEKIDVGAKSTRIINGSLVKANGMNLFISVALSKTVIDDSAIVFLSAKSPLGKKMMGLQQNDRVEMNGVNYLIERVE
jgi:transcription elongation GreA/GreB family factor